MDPCFHDVCAKFWHYHLNVQLKFRLVLVSLGESQPPFVVRQEWHLARSSAAAAHLIQGSTCCARRDEFLNSLFVTSSYLLFYNLKPVCPFSSGLSNQQHILVHPTAITGYSLCVRTIHCKPLCQLAGAIQNNIHEILFKSLK